MISHDRWFLDRTCTHILAWEGNVEEGKWFWFEGNFEAYGPTRSSGWVPMRRVRTGSPTAS